MQKPPPYRIYQQGREAVPRLEPPAYPGYTQAFQKPAGYHESYESSEAGSTDLSLSSSENLSTSLRQDPQGEETYHSNVFTNPIDIMHSNQPPGYIPGPHTSVEVKSTNSSTFYVTGSAASQEEITVGNYSTIPQVAYGVQPLREQQGYPNQYYANSIPDKENEMYMQCLQPAGIKPQENSHQPSVTYSHISNAGIQDFQQPYNQMSSSSSSQAFITKQVADSQNLGGMSDGTFQQNSYSSQPYFQSSNFQSECGSMKSVSPQSASKQDPFKKWRHFYVNQKSQLQPYHLLQQGSERGGQFKEGVSNQNNPGRHDKSPNQPNNNQYYVQNQQKKGSPSLQNSSGQNNNSGIKSGSMIDRLKREFSEQSGNLDNLFNSDRNVKQGNNLRTVNDQIRSATPDFLSEKSHLISRQLPLRPSSANSNRNSQDLKKLSVFKSTNQNQMEQKSDLQMFRPYNSINNESPVVHDHGLPGSNLPPDVDVTRSNPEGISAPSSEADQSENILKLKVKNIRPSTAPPLRTGLQQQSAYLGGSESDNSALSLSSPEHKKDLQRSCEMLHRVTNVESQPSARNHDTEMDQAQPEQKQMIKQEKGQGNSLDNQNNNRAKSNELDHAAIATRATQMVERLSEENRTLRQELEGYYSKVCRLQKLEIEIQKITDAHEALEKHSSKRETLDKIMRLRLETEVKKLREINHDLKDQLEKALSKIDTDEAYVMTGDTELKREVREKDSMITKLIGQNRELNKARDRLEIDLATQQSRCKEHTNHIEILEAALKSAHVDRLKMQDDLFRMKLNERKIKQLQNTMAELRSAVEKRESIEEKLRSKLDDEICLLKNQKFGTLGKASDTDEGISSDCESGSRLQLMTQQMQEQSQLVLRLEAQVAQCQQKVLEERALRQLSSESESLPKDVNIVDLHQNSQDMEQLINESRIERLKHLEELYSANKKSAEFEAKVKTLQTHLAEKEAMIQVLQRHMVSLSRTSSMSSLLPSPIHSPHQSLTSPARPSSGIERPMSPALASRLQIFHAKSNSEGAVFDSSVSNTQPSATRSSQPGTSRNSPATDGSKKSSPRSNKSLKELLTAQAKLFQRWQSEQPDDITKECWQV